MSKLKGYRVMCGFTQEQLATILGIDRVTYNYKENSKRTFTRSEQSLITHEINNKLPGISNIDIFGDETV